MITLPRPLATRLLHQAQSSPEQRICGLLLARDGEPETITPLRNAAAEPTIDQAFDPAEYAAAVQQADQQGLQPMALYISYPHQPPLPSAADLAARPAPELPLLVMSLDIKGVLEMRAFDPDGDGVRETPVRVFL